MALSSILTKAIGSAKDAIKNVTAGAKTVATAAGNAAKQVTPMAYSWTGKTADQMSTLEKTAYLRKNGQKAGAREAFAALADEMRSRSSRHYSPYLTGKSNQKEAMDFFGRSSFDQDWLDSNRFLLNYVSQLDWTDTVSTSGQAKWSDAQKAGYYWQMLNEAEKTTQAAEQEWKSLRTSMQENFNEYKKLYGEAPSYEKLMSYINMNDYGTLQKMDKVYDNVEDLVRLNRAVDYTPETMIGVYAALLNGKDVTGSGDWFEEAVQYTMQPQKIPGKQKPREGYSGWSQQQIDQKREEIRKNGTRADLARFEAELYASTPHLDSVDSESYFTDHYYDQKFLDKYAYLDSYVEQLRNRDGDIEKPASSDPWWYDAAYEYGTIRGREDVTKAAEEEWKALRAFLTSNYDPESDPQDELDSINWDRYPTLKALRDGQDIDLNRPVYFSDEAILGVLKAAGDGSATDNDDLDYALYETPVKAPAAEYNAPEKAAWWTEAVEALKGTGEDGETVSHNYAQVLVDELGYEEGLARARSMVTYLRQGGDTEQAEMLEKQIAKMEKPEAKTDSAAAEEPSEELRMILDPHGIPGDVRIAAPEVQGPPKPQGYSSESASTELFQNKPVVEEPKKETVADQRISFLDTVWNDVTGNKTSDEIAIRKAFYEQHGRDMNAMEREKYGLAPLSMEAYPGGVPELGDMEIDKQSIFTDEMNAAAQKIIDPKTGKGYENMDQLLANDPAVLSDIFAYIDTTPAFATDQVFTNAEVQHLKLLKRYQDDIDNKTIENLFRTYADANAVDDDVLQASLQYIIESGLTLEEKSRLGLLDNSLTSTESLQLAAQRSRETFVERGNEITRSMAIAMLPKDAPEWLVNTVDAGVSHLFAVETGIAGGILKTQKTAFSTARDLWSAVNMYRYSAILGEDYTLDEACEIDPLLRGLTAATDTANMITDVAAPDMSNYGYGAAVTQMLVDSAVSQKAANFYAPAGKSFVSSAMKKLGLGDLGVMMASDSRLYRFVGKSIDAAAGATPWMLRSMSESAQEAREMGASEADAICYGVYSGGTTGLVEGVLGQAYDGLLDKTSNLISKGLAKVCKNGMSNLTQSKGYLFVTNLLQQAFSESLEEMAELPLDQIGRSAFLGEKFALGGEQWVEAWDGAKMSFLSSIFTSLFFGLTADTGSKERRMSEKLAEMLTNGDIKPEELMVYMADPEGTPSSQSDREAARIIEENQAALDQAAVEAAAEEVVKGQIDAGALEDINGDAATNTQTTRAMEADVQAVQQEVDDLTLQIEETDNQKRAALYDMVSNGISSAKGAAKQLVHNLDEAKAALVRRQEETARKLAEKQQALQLQLDKVDAEIAQRLDDLKKEALDQKRKELADARKKADEAVAERIAALKQLADNGDVRMYSEVWGENDEYGPESGTMQEEEKDQPVSRGRNDQVPDQQLAGSTVTRRDIAADISGYIPLPLKAEESLQMRQSIQEGIKRIRSEKQEPEIVETDDAGEKATPYVAPEGYEEVSKDDFKKIKDYVTYLGRHNINISDEHFYTHYDARTENDPIRTATQGEYTTLARSNDGRYIMLFSTAEWKNYNDAMRRYRETDTWLRDEYRKLDQIADKTERDKMRAYLDNERADNRKPETPRGSYRIIDTSRITEGDARDTSKLYHDEVVKRIDSRIRKLELKNELLKQQGTDGVDIDRVSERIDVLKSLKERAATMGLRQFEARMNHLYESGSEKSLTVQEVRSLLDNMPGFERTESEAAKRLRQMTVSILSNKNQANGVMQELSGKNGYQSYSTEAIHYASSTLLDALSDVGAAYDEKGNLVPELFVELHPDLFYYEDNGAGAKEAWTGDSLEQRLATHYTSPLAEANDKYTAIDSSGGVNLVVAKKDTRLDPAQTGDVRVNPDIHSVADATEALQRVLDETSDLIKQQAEAYAPNWVKEDGIEPKLSANQRRYYAGNVIYSVRNDAGELVNRAVTAFVDPATGEKRWPSAEDLLAVAERITVNYTHYDVYYPTKFEYFDKKDGEYQTRSQMSPSRDASQDQYRFTLEKESLAPGYAVDAGSNVDASRYEPDDDFSRAERDYVAYVGQNASPEVMADYFLRVCDANYNRHVRLAAEASRRQESAGVTDQELKSLESRIENHRAAATAWRYLGMQIAAAQNEQDSGNIGKILKKFNSLLKESGNASLRTKSEIAFTLRRSTEAIRLNQLKANIPEDVTLQSLQAQRTELVEALDAVMNARNQPAVAGEITPSAANNEPLAQAIMEAVDLVDRQIEIVSAQPTEEAQDEPEAAPEEVQPVQEEAPVEAPALSDEVSQNPGNVTDTKTEEADPVAKQQEMDRTYLEAVINQPPVSEEEPRRELLDAETGESVDASEAPAGEYVEAETGEFISFNPDIPAEDLSWTAPVEEYAKRAGLQLEYDDVSISSRPTHNQVERQLASVRKATTALTRRIDDMQSYLSSEVGKVSDQAAVRQTMKNIIAERNRLKALGKQLEAKISESAYLENKKLNNIAERCVSTGGVPWDEVNARREEISKIYSSEIDGMRERLRSKLYAGKTTVLTVQDVAEVLGDEILEKELRMNYEIGKNIGGKVSHDQALLEKAEERLQQYEGMLAGNKDDLELQAMTGHIISEINDLKTRIEHGRETMRAFFDSGSDLSLADLLSGEKGGTLPLNVMNRIFAILKDVDAHSKTTNRKLGLTSDADIAQRNMEAFTGEWAPLFNALYFNPVMSSNASMKQQRGSIVDRLKASGIDHKTSADAMLYAEGKMTDEELEQKYPSFEQQKAIRKGVQVYRELYDDLFAQVNGALMVNGLEPIPYRESYVHHVKEVKSAIAKACTKLGIRITEDTLPTSLAGHTDETKPRHSYAGFAEERKGNDTKYDLEGNTMAYVDAALRIIHHTDNISRLRQLEGVMDLTMNKRAIKAGLAQYGELVDTSDLNRTTGNGKTAFSSMREWVTEYTNLLAGKQSLYDRPLEHGTNRNALQVASGLKGLVGSSIVVGNLNIATTNILPIMTMAGISPAETASALADVVRGGSEGMQALESQSEFLASRFADKQFDMNWAEALTGKVMIPFEAIDRFAANVVVRTFQKIGIKKGWSPDVAMRWADQMALRMMASKNVGESTNIMQSKGLGIALQFSREGVNNLQFLMHDLPAISNGGGDWLKKLMGIMLGGWLYNAAFNKKTALEPITPTLESIREWDGEKGTMENLGNAAGNFAEMLNPTNLGTGGDLSEVPVVSSLVEAGQAAWDIAKGEDDGLENFLMATLGFVPGGLTIERVINACGDYYRGYTTDDQGNIKYTIDNDLFSAGSIHDGIFTLLLSSSGTLGSREYTRSGYDKLSPTETSAFHTQKKLGKSNQEAYDAVTGYTSTRTNSNASGMKLPKWAVESQDAEWMQTALNAGPEAYPSETPDTISSYKLTEEDKAAFEKLYRTTYKSYINAAIADSSSLSKAAAKAYQQAKSTFSKRMEGE